MRFSAVMIVLNGMPWLPYLMKNIYPHVDEFVIVEGAQAHIRSISDAEGHSIDETVQVIKNFPDPDKKIRLIQNNRHWVDRDEMFEVGTANLTGDYLWQIDVDEFYLSEDIAKFKNFIAHHPNIEAYSFISRDFFGGIRGYVMGGEYYRLDYQRWRVWRWKQGYKYIKHEPPTVLTEDGIDTRAKGFVTGNELYRELGILCYHYSFVLPEQVRLKSISESERSVYHKNAFFMGRSQETLRNWYQNHYVRFTPWEVGMKPLPSWLEPYNGPHPAEIEAMMTDIANGVIPVKLREGDEIDRFLESVWQWRLWKGIGLLGFFYLNKVKPIFRPIIQWVRHTFFGYDYTEANRTEAEQRALARLPWHQ